MTSHRTLYPSYPGTAEWTGTQVYRPHGAQTSASWTPPSTTVSSPPAPARSGGSYVALQPGAPRVTAPATPPPAHLPVARQPPPGRAWAPPAQRIRQYAAVAAVPPAAAPQNRQHPQESEHLRAEIQHLRRQLEELHAERSHKSDTSPTHSRLSEPDEALRAELEEVRSLAAKKEVECAALARELNNLQARLMTQYEKVAKPVFTGSDAWTPIETPHEEKAKEPAMDSSLQVYKGAQHSEGCTQVVAASAAGGALVLGAGGAASGLLLGGTAGAALGLLPAIFTFGLSIPAGAVLGGGFGSLMGGMAGSTAGAASGGIVGYRVFKVLDRIRRMSGQAQLKDAPEYTAPEYTASDKLAEPGTPSASERAVAGGA